MWEKLARFRERYRGRTLYSGHVLTSEAPSKHLKEAIVLQLEYPFLSYASEYWLHNSAYFEKKILRPGVCGKDCYFLKMDLLKCPRNTMSGLSVRAKYPNGFVTTNTSPYSPLSYQAEPHLQIQKICIF